MSLKAPHETQSGLGVLGGFFGYGDWVVLNSIAEDLFPSYYATLKISGFLFI